MTAAKASPKLMPKIKIARATANSKLFDAAVTLHVADCS